jgi:hypothetical protein
MLPPFGMKMYYDFIMIGSLSGGFLSGLIKINEIPYVKKHTKPEISIDIECIYQTSPIAVHAGVGSVIGGITAATAPISIPAYIWWMNRHNK